MKTNLGSELSFPRERTNDKFISWPTLASTFGEPRRTARKRVGNQTLPCKQRAVAHDRGDITTAIAPHRLWVVARGEARMPRQRSVRDRTMWNVAHLRFNRIAHSTWMLSPFVRSVSQPDKLDSLNSPESGFRMPRKQIAQDPRDVNPFCRLIVAWNLWRQAASQPELCLTGRRVSRLGLCGIGLGLAIALSWAHGHVGNPGIKDPTPLRTTHDATKVGCKNDRARHVDSAGGVFGLRPDAHLSGLAYRCNCDLRHVPMGVGL